MILDEIIKHWLSSRAVLVLLTLEALLVASLLAAKPAHASTTFTVNSTADQADANTKDGLCVALNGSCTLRAAIEQANATPGADVINFNIATGGQAATISPNSALPEITEQVTIDGYSQPGAAKNTETQPGKTNASPKIELNGSDAPLSTLLSIHNTSSTVIRGLVINRYNEHGILLDIGTTGTKIEGNFIGTGPDGTEFAKSPSASANLAGIEVGFASDNTIGGTTPEARNIIPANAFGSGGGDGVRISGSSAKNKVQGNLIGTAKDGITRLTNGDGVEIDDNASDNTIGGDTPDAANTIALNLRVGVRVGQAANDNLHGNRILSNSIFSNGNMGIDLGSDGLTSNDSGDIDAGPNNLQNFPVLTSAKTGRRGTTIKGTLNSTPSTATTTQTFTIQFFSNPKDAGSTPQLVQGKTFIGQKSVTTDGSGNASFAFKAKQKVGAGQTITATATDDLTDTSEFSAAKKVVKR